jgi:signal transduction histidine kinase
MAGYGRKDRSGPEAIDLNKVASRVLKFLPYASNGKVGFIQDLSPEEVLVSGRETALTTTLVNLVVNALDAMPSGGMLFLRTRIEGPGKVSITIQDTGEGMSEETLARATEPFFTTKPAGKGTGLGLARVRETVEAHGGTLAISSEEGVGTTVRIELPRSTGV